MKKQSNSPKKSTPKKKASKSSRPTYQQMVTEALKTLNARNGSSRAKILNHLKNTYGVEGGKTANSHLRSALEALIADKTIALAKGSGVSDGYFRITPKGKDSGKKTFTITAKETSTIIINTKKTRLTIPFEITIDKQKRWPKEKSTSTKTSSFIESIEITFAK